LVGKNKMLLETYARILEEEKMKRVKLKAISILHVVVSQINVSILH